MTSAVTTPSRTQVREATDRDLDTIVSMGEAFLRETPYGTQIGTNPEQLRTFARTLMQGAGAIAVTGGDVPTGMIAVWCFVHPFSGERIASELVWWVNPEERGSTGVRLLRWAEAWARAQGAVALQMIAPTDRVGAFYERRGYTRVEVSYQRRF